MFKRKKSIYLDYASGTPLDREVFLSMKPYFKKKFHNPGALYKEGIVAQKAIEISREHVSDALGSHKQEIFFVDGGTEANNLALIGTIRAWQKQFPEKVAHIITSEIEHVSVIQTCKFLEKEGVLVDYLKVNEQGSIFIQDLKQSITENTVIISIAYVNGEIGVIQDLRGIMKTIRYIRKKNKNVYPYMHTDAVQAVNYISTIGVCQLGIDLMTISGSKIYGPKKIAVLFIKKGTLICSVTYGGNQEYGIRSGTENVPYIVGMASSLVKSRNLQKTENARLGILREYMFRQLHHCFDDLIINAEVGECVPNIVNISFKNLSHEEIVLRLDAKGVMCSVKSACKSGEDGDSHVIRAIRADGENTGSVRFSFGRLTQRRDIDYVITTLKNIFETMDEVRKKYMK